MSARARVAPDLGADELRADLLQRLAAAADGSVEAGTISADDSLRDDLGLGSLDAILLVLDLEESYGIDIEDDELAALDTVGSLLALIGAKRPGPPPAPA